MFSRHISTGVWLQHTQAIIEKSREERHNSHILYTEVSRSMLTAADECFSVWYETNGAFATRIAEIGHAKKEIERHLAKLNADIETLKRQMGDIQKALDEKKPALQVNIFNYEKICRRSFP